MTSNSNNNASSSSTAASSGILRRLLEEVAAGKVSPGEAMKTLSATSGTSRAAEAGSRQPQGQSGPAKAQDLQDDQAQPRWRSALEDIGFAQIDHERADRVGFPEVVYGEGKTPEQVAAIASRVFERSGVILVTRTNQEAFEATRKLLTDAHFEADARMIWADSRTDQALAPGLTVVSAGTSDLPVAREAVITARLMGCDVAQVQDVGVAGLHRLVGKLDQLREAKVLIVVAGMEGALPSVVAGLVSAPVIAVPTSVGYGASFEGLAALLAMMNSCASGVSVVNIDGGFAAGFQAALITRAIAGV